jgi:hypothetical protein
MSVYVAYWFDIDDEKTRRSEFEILGVFDNESDCDACIDTCNDRDHNIDCNCCHGACKVKVKMNKPGNYIS